MTRVDLDPVDLDPVALRLAASGPAGEASLRSWLEAERRRNLLRRRAAWCALSGYGLITLAALASSLIAILLAAELKELFVGDVRSSTDLPASITVAPVVLSGTAVLISAACVVAWLVDGIPGLRSVRSAIDWNAVGDAISRLLDSGCTFPEAFRRAAEVVRTSATRQWLKAAQRRVEAGSEALAASDRSRGDVGVFELLVALDEAQPVIQWSIAANHFQGVAKRRFGLLLGSMPVLATVIAGILIWISISVTLGSVWWATAELIEGLG